MKYFVDDAKEKVDPTLFDEKAESTAKKFGEAYFKGKRSINNSKSQIRKFYDEVLRNKTIIENTIYSQDEEFKRRLPYIKMLKAKAAYAREREKITPSFKDFIDQNIDSIMDWNDFKVFCDFFESVVAYSAVYVKKN